MGPQCEELPKPLFRIGEKPVLWHIMRIFSSYGFNDFILCAGHKMEMINRFAEENKKEGWNIQVVDTGKDSTKAERIRKVAPLIKTDDFFVSYGDDLANIDLKKLVDFHKRHGKTATLTAVRLLSPFGVLELGKDDSISAFREKPLLDKWMNGGYMVFKKSVFSRMGGGELEDHILPELAKSGEVYAYRHEGGWKTMNTLKDNDELNELWKNGKAFWKVWK